MGTLLALTVAGEDSPATAGWIETTFDTATACERVMSRHDPDAELSRLNGRSGDARGFRSAALAGALAQASAMAELTSGAFDPTVAPVLDVWRRAARRGARPSPSALERARRRVDWRKIRVSGAHVTLASGAAVDLGGIGKGLALDAIARQLRRRGCRSAILNFGESSLVALGRPPGGRWRVALRHPLGGFAGELTLRDRACSTSCTASQRRMIGRTPVSHIVDPRTARPLTEIAQVTVLARTAAVAEALSTALLVLGPDAIDELSRRARADACWIDARGIRATPWFPLRTRRD
jgi:thiamine biosynthesis lipoprotein